MTDCDRWREPWFSRLTPEAKLTFLFIESQADPSGAWRPDLHRARFEIGFETSPNWDSIFKELTRLGDADMKRQLEILPSGIWWLVNHVKEQVGIPLRFTAPRHVGVLRALKRNQLVDRFLKRHGPGSIIGPRGKPLTPN